MHRIFASKISGILLTFFAAVTLIACSGESSKQSQDTATAESDTAMSAMKDSAIVKLNINTASDSAFKTIPNVGDRMAAEFDEYRPYASIRQFRKEIGKYVDEAQVAAYEQYIYVPIDYNSSDSETLQQIPGLDASEAEELIGARPFDSEQAFIDALSGMVGEEELATARTYLAAD